MKEFLLLELYCLAPLLLCKLIFINLLFNEVVEDDEERGRAAYHHSPEKMTGFILHGSWELGVWC